jgi:hypothetical protein
VCEDSNSVKGISISSAEVDIDKFDEEKIQSFLASADEASKHLVEEAVSNISAKDEARQFVEETFKNISAGEVTEQFAEDTVTSIAAEAEVEMKVKSFSISTAEVEMDKFVENLVISNEEKINIFVGQVKVKSHLELTEKPIESKATQLSENASSCILEMEKSTEPTEPLVQTHDVILPFSVNLTDQVDFNLVEIPNLTLSTIRSVCSDDEPCLQELEASKNASGILIDETEYDNSSEYQSISSSENGLITAESNENLAVHYHTKKVVTSEQDYEIGEGKIEDTSLLYAATEVFLMTST